MQGQSVEVIVAVGATVPSLAQLAGLDQDLVRMQIVEERAGDAATSPRSSTRRNRGTFIVITEDHCLFPPGWLGGLAQAAMAISGAVCGGPVDNGRISRVGWAQYFTRYAAFLPVTSKWASHQPAGQQRLLSGQSDCRPQGASAKTDFGKRSLIMRSQSMVFRFTSCPNYAIVQNQHRTASEYVPLRFRHGRCYGARRSNSLPGLARAKLLLLVPSLPFLLYFRIARSVVLSRWIRSAFLLASPFILIYVFAWTAGEITGYLAGPGRAARRRTEVRFVCPACKGELTDGVGLLRMSRLFAAPFRWSAIFPISACCPIRISASKKTVKRERCFMRSPQSRTFEELLRFLLRDHPGRSAGSRETLD